MAAVLSNALFVLVARVWTHLPSLDELSRSMNSEALRDGSRYL